ncbi:MAG: HlyD family type I secretion periplasmic adaptor subunit, partial [Hyphomicrobiaceae bacterium]
MRKRDELEFLPAAIEVLETPPHPAARAVAILVGAAFVSAVAWGILGHIDVVAVARGKIVPAERVKSIQPLENGVIAKIHVKDGQKVARGELLVELDSTEMQASVDSVRADLSKAWLDVAAAAALLRPNPGVQFIDPEAVPAPYRRLASAARARVAGDIEKLRAKLAEIDAQISEQGASLNEAQSRLERAKRIAPLVDDLHETMGGLMKKGLARKTEWFEAQRRKIENESEIVKSRAAIDQALARRAARLKSHEEAVATARAEALHNRSEALSKVAKYEQQLIREERRMKERQLRAPVAGTVFGLTVHTVGGVVTTKDVILQIVPQGTRLEVEATILNKDVGFVQEGQEVEIKIDTFPFTRYGLVVGKIENIWRDAVPDEEHGLV